MAFNRIASFGRGSCRLLQGPSRNVLEETRVQVTRFRGLGFGGTPGELHAMDNVEL